MLDAVNIGCSQPRTLCLSSRRSIRRLRWASCRRILVFTRNPFLLEVLNSVATLQTPPDSQEISSFFDFSTFNRPWCSLVQGLERTGSRPEEPRQAIEALHGGVCLRSKHTGNGHPDPWTS